MIELPPRLVYDGDADVPRRRDLVQDSGLPRGGDADLPCRALEYGCGGAIGDIVRTGAGAGATIAGLKRREFILLAISDAALSCGVNKLGPL